MLIHVLDDKLKKKFCKNCVAWLLVFILLLNWKCLSILLWLSVRGPLDHRGNRKEANMTVIDTPDREIKSEHPESGQSQILFPQSYIWPPWVEPVTNEIDIY